MIFYIADTHFCYEPVMASRGFSTAAEMDEALIANWNSVVGEADTVYFLGDIGYNGGHVPCHILERLRGHKHLIRGNHDTGYEDAPLLYRYFDSVTDFWELDDNGTHVLLSHYPMLYNKRGYMIHGHLHDSSQFFEILKTLPKVLNAGVDLNGLKPVTLEQLIENNQKFYAGKPVEYPYRPRCQRGFLPAVPDFRPIPERPREETL
ncbi:MAG: metallophosphoesterase [Oscillospiraceae bacterium]|nr:metallophosphoesterase [Oscillospiraceae bacterium]